MNIDGGCHCGAIAYEAEIDPTQVGICHCTDCQQLTGTAFRITVFAPEDKFRLTRGKPKIYVKTAESGSKRAQAFCADCGSPLYATSVDEGPKFYGIRVGTARQRAQLKPTRQVWHRSALPWLPDMEGLVTKEKG
jgi:hypothetical protein